MKKPDTTNPRHGFQKELLYGMDKEECLVAAHQQSESSIRLYKRKEDTVTHRDVPFYPFAYFSNNAPMEKFTPSSGEKYWYLSLSGTNYFNRLAIFKSVSAYRESLEFANQWEKKFNKELVYDRGDMVNKYLYQTGKTFFKNMVISDARRMQIDIETLYDPSDNTHKSGIGESKIIIISLSDSTGWEKVIHAGNQTEKSLLQEFISIIHERDPDVIEGHNIYSFDLPYIEKRCELLDVPFSIGRNFSVPRSFSTSIRFAERSLDYPCYEIAGRHIIDTLFLVQSFDVARRSLPSYGLKAVAKYFGFASDDRTYIDYADITKLWKTDRDRMLRYALDDVRETRSISDMLIGSHFYLTEMLPFSFSQVARMGPAAKIESLFVRNYLNRKQSLPKPQQGDQGKGGFTRVFLSGILGPIIYADVESLYPSVMLTYNICPESDEAKLFSTILSSLKDMRFSAKKEMISSKKKNEEKNIKRYDAMQNSYKTLINSMYGYLGFRHGIFNDYKAADLVTTKGQEIARKMIQEFEKKGSRVVEVDTDGIFLIPPPEITKEEDERNLVQEISNRMPEGIQIGFEGRFKKIISYKKKNYVLLKYDGNIKIKGSSLISRSLEKFGRDFVRRTFEALLQENTKELRDLYLSYRDKIMTRSMDIEEISRTESLKKTLEEYQNHINAGKGKQAPYEISKRYKLKIVKGQRLSYYVAGSSLGAAADLGKPATMWDKKNPDQNIGYYLQRLDDIKNKFKPFFSASDFSSLFSFNELFPVDVDAIKIIKEKVVHQEEEESIPF